MTLEQLARLARTANRKEPLVINSSSPPPIRIGLSSSFGSSSPPTTISLRSKCPTPYDQGQTSSCTANAIAACRQVVSPLAYTPSRLFIYARERQAEEKILTDDGADPYDGLEILQQIGVCPEHSWPFIPANLDLAPPEYLNSLAIPGKVTSIARVDPTTDGIKVALFAGLPVVVGIVVYSSMMGDDVAKSGQVPIPSGNEQCLGGHAVLVVGFNGSSFEFLNSWGINWGNSGFGYFPTGYIDAGLVQAAMVISKV